MNNELNNPKNIYIMRKPTLKDISAVRHLLDEAKDRPIGTELSDILKEILPECYNQAMILISDFIVNPTVGVKGGTKQTVLVFTKLKDNGCVCPKPEDIDDLNSQYRWDMVCQILNQLEMTTDEIKDL